MSTHVVLTLDHELFLGAKSGTVENCLIKPSQALLPLLDQHAVRCTVFFDILHYWKVLQESPTNAALQEDAKKIQTNIAEFLSAGHEIQLHLHPHWLDAVYNGGQWSFPHYRRYRLHSLSTSPAPDDMATILGCFTQGRAYLEQLCSATKPGYRVTAFRAGGWCLEPFALLKAAFQKNGLRIDSSAAADIVVDNNIHAVDYRSLPKKDAWRFDDNPNVEKATGEFIEIPISTFRNNVFQKLRALFARRFEPSISFKIPGDGEPIRLDQGRNPLKKFATAVKFLSFENLTFHEMARGYDTLVGEGKQRVVLAGHSKYLSPYALNQLDRFIVYAKTHGGLFVTLSETARQI